ncbi:MAG: hypothetical protein WCQ41_00760 [Bacillota bacterium]
MKSRFTAVTIILLLISTMFVGCNSIEYPNVPYFAAADKFNDDGWRPYVSIQAKDNKLADVVFDAANIDAKTSLIQAVNDGTAAKYKVDASLADQLKKCAKALIEKQSPDVFKFDEKGVTTQIPGVTLPVKEYFELAKKAISTGSNTSAERITEGAMSFEETNFDKDGWKTIVYIFGASNTALAINLDMINAKGESKKEVGKDKVWISQMNIVEKTFLADQPKTFFEKVKLQKDGTTKDIVGVKVNISSLYTLLKDNTVSVVTATSSPAVSPSVAPSPSPLLP